LALGHFLKPHPVYYKRLHISHDICETTQY